MSSEIPSQSEMGDPSEGKQVGVEVEEYDCGCRVRFRNVDYGEAGDELPRKPLLIPDYTPCPKHKNLREVPPRDARLIMVRHEHENFLNE